MNQSFEKARSQARGKKKGPNYRVGGYYEKRGQSHAAEPDFYSQQMAHKTYYRTLDAVRVSQPGDAHFFAAQKGQKRICQGSTVRPGCHRSLQICAFSGIALAIFEDIASTHLYSDVNGLWCYFKGDCTIKFIKEAFESGSIRYSGTNKLLDLLPSDKNGSMTQEQINFDNVLALFFSHPVVYFLWTYSSIRSLPSGWTQNSTVIAH